MKVKVFCSFMTEPGALCRFFVYQLKTTEKTAVYAEGVVTHWIEKVDRILRGI